MRPPDDPDVFGAPDRVEPNHSHRHFSMGAAPSIHQAFSDIGAEGIAEAELAPAPEDIPSGASARRERFAELAAVGCGGLLGAPTRYWVGRWATAQWGSGFPWGTLFINLTGSFILGLFLTFVMDHHPTRASARLFFATGFLGAYTTFSTFSYETVRLAQHGHAGQAALYVAASLGGGMAAAALGIVAASKV